jgi:hypothetical protein
MKAKIGAQLQNWMEEESNLEKWEDGVLTASERRIMLTHFVGEAHQALVTKHSALLRKSFETTGKLKLRRDQNPFLTLLCFNIGSVSLSHTFLFSFLTRM